MLKNRYRTLDGGLASALQDAGHNIDGTPLWSARLLYDNEDSIIKAHTSFLNSGADIIATCSYQASVEGFAKYLNLSHEDGIRLIKKSVTLARNVTKKIEREVLIAGSVGPFGACLSDGSEYTGAYMNAATEYDIISWHKPRICALIESAIDLIALETFPSLQEAIYVLKLLKEYPDTRVIVSFSCKDETSTNYGDNFAEAFKQIYELGGNQVEAIGINCTHPRYVSGLLRKAAASVPIDSIPRIVYPNSGETWNAGVGWEPNSSSGEFSTSEMSEWVSLGAKIIGGCCRITPNHISKISQFIKTIE